MKMYDNQNKLPHLPLPLLNDTCDKLLDWSRPLISEADYNYSLKVVNEFLSDSGMGTSLEDDLIKFNNQENILNWLEPFWSDYYFKNRSALPINSNVSFILEKNDSVKELNQSELAASLAITLFQYNKILLDENIPINYHRTTPLCMSQYKTMLGTSRIPSINKDYLVTNSHSKHIAFIVEGNFYIMNILDSKNQIKDYSSILLSIKWMIENSAKKIDTNSIGNLTSLNRKLWANLRIHLIKISPLNLDFINLIENALVVIVLDQKEYSDKTNYFKTMLCGDSNNRWYDKSIQFIITKDTQIGLNYEHSGVDGTTIENLQKYLFNKMESYKNHSDTLQANQPFKLIFEKDQIIIDEIKKAKEESKNSFDNLSIELLFFNQFGKQFMKSNKISPDSIVQIAIQLTQHKTFNKIFNIYEAVSTKQFYHGRTETTRPVTDESIKFINDKTKENLLDAAVKHIERIIECKNGYGINRHLFGLFKMYETHHSEEKIPEFFNTPSYKTITYNNYSTSTSNSTGLILAGYGPVVNDGYAIRYLIYDDKLHFVLSSKLQNKDNLIRLKNNLEASLNEIASILNDN